MTPSAYALDAPSRPELASVETGDEAVLICDHTGRVLQMPYGRFRYEVEGSIDVAGQQVVARRRWLQVRLEGTGGNRFGIGARIALRSGSQEFVQELMPTRGFQSSMDLRLNFGVGPVDTLDSVTVEWPDGRVSTMAGVAADRRVSFEVRERLPRQQRGRSSEVFGDVEPHEHGNDRPWWREAPVGELREPALHHHDMRFVRLE